MTTPRPYNFAAGPATLPEEVRESAQAAVLEYAHTGQSILELNHRSAEFCEIRDTLKASLRSLLGVPDEYEILFLQGGARQQFAMIGANFGTLGKPPAYVVTGHWGKCALDELSSAKIDFRVAWDGESAGFRDIPDMVSLEQDHSYVHVTTNETIHAVQLPADPVEYLSKIKPDLPVFADVSSDLTSRKIPISRYDLLYACAQKLCGIPGNTIVILRKDLAAKASNNVAKIWSYKNLIGQDSLYNTSPVFPIFVSMLMTNWMLKRFKTIEAIESYNLKKFEHVMKTVSKYPGLFELHATSKAQSKMNIVLKMSDDNQTKELIAAAKAAGFIGIAGHRALGGIRISNYTAVEIEAIQKLCEFLEAYAKTK